MFSITVTDEDVLFITFKFKVIKIWSDKNLQGIMKTII